MIVKVLQENKLDLMIQLHSALPPGKIGLAPEPSVNDRSPSVRLRPERRDHRDPDPGRIRAAPSTTPTFQLITDKNGRKVYVGKTSTTPTTVPGPGLPFSINFWSEPGMEHLTLKAASAYQAASRRRVPPPMFGPLPGEPRRQPVTSSAAR